MPQTKRPIRIPYLEKLSSDPSLPMNRKTPGYPHQPGSPEYDGSAAYEAFLDENVGPKRRPRGCLCGNPDLPGSCPGPTRCPMHGE
jgi:hypothetical protein